MKYTHEQVKVAKELLERVPDGSIANLQARARSNNNLKITAAELMQFCYKNPDSGVADYILAEVESMENIAKYYNNPKTE